MRKCAARLAPAVALLDAGCAHVRPPSDADLSGLGDLETAAVAFCIVLGVLVLGGLAIWASRR